MTRVKIPTKKAKHISKFGKLILDDGSVYSGKGFGWSGVFVGELVFNTGMVGYTEALTDPSYRGQILVLTYPLVGNYGVPDKSVTDKDGIPKHFESGKIQAGGLVVHELSLTASHWNLSMTLDEWLFEEKIPGISGIDTRGLTKKLRENGVMMAILAVADTDIDEKEMKAKLRTAPQYNNEEFMDLVSTTKSKTYGNERKNVVVIDTGVKNAILRNIRRIGYKVIQLPWNSTIEKVMSYKPKGVVISNGPGDPKKCPETVETAKFLIKQNIPTLGICLGAQILGLAGGADTYKLKYGHRGQNKPCLNLNNDQVYVTSQNHGYGIDPDSLKKSEFNLWFTNTDDKTVEGIKHKEKKCLAVQFHPEASPGPYDCMYVFEELKNIMEEGRSGKK